MPLARVTMGWSEVYDYVISWSYALAYAVAFSSVYKHIKVHPLDVVKPSNWC